MNIQRFHAATAREALAKARMAFGEGTLILSNRPTATGVEVLATGEDALNALDESSISMTDLADDAAAYAAEPLVRSAPAVAPSARNLVQEDTENLAMSTLSFQDYVRERMLRRRHEELHGSAQPAEAAAVAAPVRQDGGALSVCAATASAWASKSRRPAFCSRPSWRRRSARNCCSAALWLPSASHTHTAIS